MRKLTSSLCALRGVAALCLLSAACTAPIDQAPGCRDTNRSKDITEPPNHCLFFPSEAVLDPLGDLLYVTNINGDQSFGGGTLVSVDLRRQERAVACFRRFERGQGDPLSQCGPQTCEAAFGARIAPERTMEEIGQAEAELRAQGGDPAQYDRCFCERDTLDPAIINCESHRFILRDQTVKTGNFAGQFAVLAEDPSDWPQAFNKSATLRRKLYLPVRGDPSLSYVEVERPLPSLRPSVSCGGGKRELVECADSYRLQRSPAGDEVLIDPNLPAMGTQARLTLPAEPFGVALDRGCKDPAQTPTRLPLGGYRCAAGGLYRFLVMTHMSSGEASAFHLGEGPDPQLPLLTDVRFLPFPIDGSGRRGAFGVAVRRPGDLSQPWFVTSRASGVVASFRLGLDLMPPPATPGKDPGLQSVAGPALVPSKVFSIAGSLPNASGGNEVDVRQIRFEPSGDRAFLALNRPAGVAVLDTSADPRSDPPGFPRSQVTKVINLGLEGSRFALARIPADGGRRSRLYVALFREGTVAVVEPNDDTAAGSILVGRGLSSIALNFGDAVEGGPMDACADPTLDAAAAQQRGVTCPAADALRLSTRRAYVASYLDNAVAVIDLQPGSPTLHRVISRIGLPAPKVAQ